MLLVFFSLGNYKGLGALCQGPGTEPSVYRVGKHGTGLQLRVPKTQFVLALRFINYCILST